MAQYLNPRVYARYFWGRTNLYALEHFEKLLAPEPSLPLSHPPIFFLGAPRSGSTLAVQVITDTLDLGYLTNRHCQWFGAPALAELLFRPTRNRPASNFRSQQGATDGWHAPAECGEWWYRFFRRTPPYITLNDVNPNRMFAFRRSVASIINSCNRPVIFKNLYASLRIQAIVHYLPESLFIITHRDEVDNGHSLFETRKRVFGTYNKWWSMEPPNAQKLKMLPTHQQVIEQIRNIHRVIEKDLAAANVPTRRRLDLRYERLCANPAETIVNIQSFLAANGCRIPQQATPPNPFETRTTITIDPTLHSLMKEYAQGF